MLTVLCALSLVTVQAEASRRRAVAPPAAPEWTIVPLAGYDPLLPSNDLEPLREVIGDARVVALGESYHTSGGFYRLKHRLFRFLVEEMGFRAFAMESYWQGAETANAYVQTCSGTAREAISDHISVWPSDEYAALVQWMCEWNRSHSDPADKLTLFGFDIQQPWYDGIALVTFLQDTGIPQSDARSQGIRSCEAAFGLRHPFGEIPQSVHDKCINALDAAEAHLVANRDAIVPSTSADAFAVAMLRVVGLRAWQNSVFTIAHDFAAGYNARDVGMAYAFHAMRARKAPNAKTVLWAANSHVAKYELPTGEVSIGSHLKTALGDDYVTFALTAYETDIDFPGHGCGPIARTEGSVEDILVSHGHDALLAVPDAAGSFGTQPMGTNVVRPFRDYDGIFFLRHSPKMQPHAWPSCR